MKREPRTLEELAKVYNGWPERAIALKASPYLSKECTKCGKKKKLTEYHFNLSAPSPDGRRPDCIECHRRIAMNYVRKKRQAELERLRK